MTRVSVESVQPLNDGAVLEGTPSREPRYGGDFLEEDAYADWAVSLREQARATYIDVARALAEALTVSDDHDAAVRYLLRILEKDAFDEEAHLRLVISLTGAGRHGEARRRYRAYVAKMLEIGLEAVPFPATARRERSTL